MDGSAMKRLELNGGSSDGDYQKKQKRTICISGYDTGLPEDDVKSALRKHFPSCGEMTEIYIPIPIPDTLNKYAFIFYPEEAAEAEEKALELNGSDMGGWNAVVKVLPKRKLDSDCTPEELARRAAFRHRLSRTRIIVSGYDTGLPEDDIKSALCEHFGSCGEIVKVEISNRFKKFS